MKREIKFRVWDKVDYMSSPFTLQDVQNGKIKFTPDCPIMLFTGLRDRNGKEIYEGDIIDYGHGRFRPVEFIDGAFCILKINSMPSLMTLYAVVGNIYDNPELLS